jgi:hypothetical protein
LKTDFRQADLSPKDRAMLEYAAKMTKDHHLATQDDIERLRDVGFSDAEILHIIYWIAHFNMANTLADCVGREVHENMTAVFVDDLPRTVAPGRPVLANHEALRAGAERAQVRALEGLGLEWINSRPLTWADVRNRVILTFSWDAAHPNSLLALPHLERWHGAFADQGLTILAAHAAEFPQAKDPAWIRTEIARLGIRYPVVLDPTFRRVTGSNNRYWPAVHVIDRAGFVRFRHYGPGGFGAIEAQIRALLNGGGEPGPVQSPAGLDGERWLHPETSPELYATFYIGARGGVGTGLAAPGAFSIPEPLEAHTFYASGVWTRRDDGLELADGHGRCAFQYRAERVFLFASPGLTPTALDVALDGSPVAARDAGPDLGAQSRLMIERPRVYWMIAHRGIETHRLDLHAPTAGVKLHRVSFLPFRGEVED